MSSSSHCQENHSASSSYVQLRGETSCLLKTVAHWGAVRRHTCWCVFPLPIIYREMRDEQSVTGLEQEKQTCSIRSLLRRELIWEQINHVWIKRTTGKERLCSLRSKLCCMESERYKLTVLFLKTFFRSWALSVKLKTQRETSSARPDLKRPLGSSSRAHGSGRIC